ncbi:hypothetical protein FJY63_13190 [Candidatus Sumerlaeota bacterium]|nr:hypothetical protein [Candidatus Sumerlaeota bacterium]
MARRIFLLSGEAIQLIEKKLGELVKQTRAQFSQVIDRSGYLVATCGKPPHIHPEELGTISAGVLSAIQVVVNLAESAGVTMRFHSRSMPDFHFRWVNPRVFVLVAFGSATSDQVVCDAARCFADEVSAHLAEDQSDVGGVSTAQFIEGKIEELFRDL